MTDQHAPVAQEPPPQGRGVPRIPLNTLAIAFGLAGLASMWTIESDVLDLPAASSTALWVVAAIAWGWLIVAHARRGARSAETLGAQLRHPAQGPIAAIVPVVGMLLGGAVHRFWPLGGTVLVLVFLALAAGFAGWILAFWHRGALRPEALHGAYLLPVVAAALIGATTAARIGLPLVAMAAFGVGIFFWVVILTVLLARLAFFPPLPGPLVPTLAILLAPPAVAGTAWFAMRGVHADAVSLALLGMLLLMLLVQAALLPAYRKLEFTLGFWSFTFPLTAAAGYGVEWLALAGFPGWRLVAALAGVVVTAVALAVAVRSLVLVVPVRRGARRAERPLRRADAEVEGRDRIPRA